MLSPVPRASQPPFTFSSPVIALLPSPFGGLGAGVAWIFTGPYFGVTRIPSIEKLTHFQNFLVILRGVEPSIANDIFY